MSAFQTIFSLFPIIFFSVFFNTHNAFASSEKNTFIIDDATKIRFSIPKNKYYYSNVVDELTDIRDLQNLSFIPYSEFTGLKPNSNYIKKIKIKNLSKIPETISVIAGPGHLKSKFILVSKDKVTNFTSYMTDKMKHIHHYACN